jgi:peptidoglycan LD-endopeptidase CwlK
MNLPHNIRAIQRAVGAEADGVFGPATAALVWRALHDPDDETREMPAGDGMDERSAKNLQTLDPKAHEFFQQFYNLANATAATLGCRYVMTSGNRTYAEQDALYAQGRTARGPKVTNAVGGQSNHNFGIAADFSVFREKLWLEAEDEDGGNGANRALARKVHKACSVHAAACGLEWGGNWKSIVDEPHYEIRTGLTLAQKRNVFKERGSVL